MAGPRGGQVPPVKIHRHPGAKEAGIEVYSPLHAPVSIDPQSGILSHTGNQARSEVLTAQHQDCLEDLFTGAR